MLHYFAIMFSIIHNLLDTSVQKDCEEPKSENTDKKFIHPPGRNSSACLNNDFHMLNIVPQLLHYFEIDFFELFRRIVENPDMNISI